MATLTAAAQNAVSNIKAELQTWLTSLGAGQVSAEFFELIKGIGEAKSKQEELQIVEQEAQLLKSAMANTDNELKMKELVIRALYCEMLGKPVPFAYIHAVKMTQRRSLIDKRVGYLFVALCFHDKHELMVLLINSFRRDLDSTNILEVCAALSCMSMLLSDETIPAVLEVVKKLIPHQSELVRKKAVTVIHRCLQKNPDVASEVNDALRRALCDRDPSVMAASLLCFNQLLKYHVAENPQGEVKLFKELVPSFVSILKQIVDHRLDSSFDYHKTPAPWIQIQLLRILAILGRDSSSSSEHMHGILLECMRRGDTGLNAGYAVIYECVRTICAIHPRKDLLDHAAEAISQFISSPNNNLKYMGLTLLAQIVQINPTYAVQHQMHVIQCLEDPDDSIQRKTLTLLYQMTNPRNVMIVADKLLEFLKKSTDVYLRTELVSKITSLAERYSTNIEWFIKTMNRVFLLGGDLVQPDVAFNLMRLIAEGVGDSDEANDSMRIYAVDAYLELAQHNQLPDVLVQVIAWVLGEYGFLLDSSSVADDILDVLSDLMERTHHKSSETRLWCAAALAKATSSLRAGNLRDDIASLFRKYAGSDNIELSRRCQEYLLLFEGRVPPTVIDAVLPRDASCEDVSVQGYLTNIVDAAVSRALAEGAPRFIPKSERSRAIGSTTTIVSGLPQQKKATKSLRFDKYAAPTAPGQHRGSPVMPSSPFTASFAMSPEASVDTNAPIAPVGPASNKPDILAAAGPWSKAGFGAGKIGAKATASAATATTTTAASGSATHFEPAKPASPAASSFTSSPSRSQPSKPLVDEKTQKLANDLFQGLSGDTADLPEVPAVGIRRVGSGACRAHSRSPAHQPTASLISTNVHEPSDLMHAPVSTGGAVDLLGGLSSLSGSSSSSSPMSTNDIVSTSKPVEAPKANDLLLDLDFGAASPAAPSTTSTLAQPAPATSFDLMNSMDDEVSSPVPSSSQHAVPLSPSVGDAASMLKPTVVTISPLAKQISNYDPENFKLDNLAVSDALLQFVKGQKQSPITSVITGDAHIHVSSLKVWRDDELHLCLIIGNKFPREISKVELSLAAPTGGAFIVSGVAGDGKFNAATGTVTISPFESRHAALVVVRIQYCGRLEFSVALQAQINFQVSMTQSKNLKVKVPLDAADFMRIIPPSRLNVKRYGTLWPLHNKEAKQRVEPCSVTSMEDVDAKLKETNISIIQIIGQEAVAAARLLPNRAPNAPAPSAEAVEFGGELCLFHFKLDIAPAPAPGNTKRPNALLVTVRSLDKMITDNAARYLSIVFSS